VIKVESASFGARFHQTKSQDNPHDFERNAYFHLYQ